MALVACKECQHKISHSAKTCPSCGIEEPGVTIMHKLFGFAVVLGGMFLMVHFLF